MTKNRSLGPAAAASANSYGQHTIVNDGQVGPKPNHFISIIEIPSFLPSFTLWNLFFSNPRNSFISTGVFIVVLYRCLYFIQPAMKKTKTKYQRTCMVFLLYKSCFYLLEQFFLMKVSLAIDDES